FGARRCDAVVAHERGHVRAVLTDAHRDDRLARQITTHDRGLSVVELACSEELPPAAIGAVNIRGVIEAQAPRALVPASAPTERAQCASSGSSYHRTRSPTRARSRQRPVFGTDSKAGT